MFKPSRSKADMAPPPFSDIRCLSLEMPWGCKRRAERRQVTETESRLERERSELCGALANRTVQWGSCYFALASCGHGLMQVGKSDRLNLKRSQNSGLLRE